MPLGLIALALGGFGIGLTEFVIAGLLTPVATSLGVSVPTAGYLVSGYALAVVVGALVLPPLLTKWHPKRALLLLMAFFLAGNLVSSLADGYAMLMVGRVLAALAHGAFFGIGSVLAASLVTKEKQAGAISIMFGGLTLANVLGVPMGTFVGQQFGWRATFAVIVGVGVLAAIGIFFLVPDAHADAEQRSLKAELAAFSHVQVWFSLGMTVLVFGGMFGAFMYIEPLLTNITGYSDNTIPWLLVLFGVGLFAGNMLGGKMADRSLRSTLTTWTLALGIVLVLFALTAESQFAAAALLLAMGFFGFGTVPGLQMRVMKYAAQAPTLASSANIAAFNIGNFLGVWLSGMAISAGFGFISPLWVGAAFAFAGLVVLAAADVRRDAAVATC